MKKIFTCAAKRILSVLVFIGAQVKVWALGATTSLSIHQSANVFTKPWIWIAIISVSIIVLIGPFDDNSDYRRAAKKKRQSNNERKIN